jgi:hypothetical protein
MTWSVIYDDGETADGLCHSCVRPYIPYQAGEEIDWRDSDAEEVEFIPGVILDRTGDKDGERYRIRVNYVDEESGTKSSTVVSNVVPADLRRRVLRSKQHQNSLQPGTPVVALYEDEGSWFPGIIAKVNSDGTYKVLYDDGDVEMRVPLSSIRLV